MEIVTLIASDDDIFVFMKDNLIIFKYLIDNNTLMKFISDVIDNYCVINKSDLNNYHSLLDEFEFNLSNFKIK